MSYDDTNIFAKILSGEIPCQKHDECDHTLSFFDIAPQAPIHILVIPKGAYVDMSDFAANASAEEQAAFVTAIGRSARLAGLDKDGYRVISNIGRNGHQEVPHLHVHILGGESMGPIRAK
ncbi:MAG: HIT domain-containing protein [Candidatus Puniceispirillaceae bacterium]